MKRKGLWIALAALVVVGLGAWWPWDKIRLVGENLRMDIADLGMDIADFISSPNGRTTLLCLLLGLVLGVSIVFVLRLIGFKSTGDSIRKLEERQDRLERQVGQLAKFVYLKEDRRGGGDEPATRYLPDDPKPD